jgi:hypothetical protein
MENNRLIAEFMGYHIADDEIKGENGFWYDLDVFSGEWKWLMEAVNKCLVTPAKSPSSC